MTDCEVDRCTHRRADRQKCSLSDDFLDCLVNIPWKRWTSGRAGQWSAREEQNCGLCYIILSCRFVLSVTVRNDAWRSLIPLVFCNKEWRMMQPHCVSFKACLRWPILINRKVFLRVSVLLLKLDIINFCNQRNRLLFLLSQSFFFLLWMYFPASKEKFADAISGLFDFNISIRICDISRVCWPRHDFFQEIVTENVCFHWVLEAI